MTTGPAPDPREIADGVERHLRIVGARLDAEIAAGARGVELVAGERRQRRELRRAPGGEAEPVTAVLLEQRRSQAERHGEPGRRQVVGLAGVGRRRGGRRRPAARRAARRSSGAPPSSRREQLAQVLAVGALDHVERREVQTVLGGRDDPGLVDTVERHAARRRGSATSASASASATSVPPAAAPTAAPPAAVRNPRLLTFGPAISPGVRRRPSRAARRARRRPGSGCRRSASPTVS